MDSYYNTTADPFDPQGYDERGLYPGKKTKHPILKGALTAATFGGYNPNNREATKVNKSIEAGRIRNQERAGVSRINNEALIERAMKIKQLTYDMLIERGRTPQEAAQYANAAGREAEVAEDAANTSKATNANTRSQQDYLRKKVEGKTNPGGAGAAEENADTMTDIANAEIARGKRDQNKDFNDNSGPIGASSKERAANRKTEMESKHGIMTLDEIMKDFENPESANARAAERESERKLAVTTADNARIIAGGISNQLKKDGVADAVGAETINKSLRTLLPPGVISRQPIGEPQFGRDEYFNADIGMTEDGYPKREVRTRFGAPYPDSTADPAMPVPGAGKPVPGQGDRRKFIRGQDGRPILAP